MKINGFTFKGDDSPAEIDEREFWKIFLGLLNIRGARLTDKQLDVMVYVLSGEEGVNYFKTPYKQQMQRDIDSMSDAEVTRLKGELQDRNLLKTSKIRKEDGKLSEPFLTSFQRFVKNQNSFTFVLPIIIKDD